MHTGLCALSNGAAADGELMKNCCGVQPVAVTVTAKPVPSGMPVIAVAPTVMPADGVTVIAALLGLAILMLYVPPLQTPALKLTAGVTHEVLQSAGLVTVIEVLHVPVALVAVIVTLLPIGILIIVLPLIVPALVLMTAPALALKATR